MTEEQGALGPWSEKTTTDNGDRHASDTRGWNGNTSFASPLLPVAGLVSNNSVYMRQFQK
jgi:hypothetical protein